MRVGIAADYGGFTLKEEMLPELRQWGYEVVDFGAYQLNPDDEYPDFVIPLAGAAAGGQVDKGLAICGSGVGTSIASSRVPGVRAALVHEAFSAHQGVEDDNMNVMSLGGRVLGYALARDLIRACLTARFADAERFRRCLAKVAALQNEE